MNIHLGKISSDPLNWHSGAVCSSSTGKLFETGGVSWKLLFFWMAPCPTKIWYFTPLNVASKRERERVRKREKREKNFLKASIFFTRCFRSRWSSPSYTVRACERATVEVVFERLKLFCFRFPIVSSSLFYCAENWRNRTGKLEL